ncbi:hypothetical protein ES288_A10G169800v1 [Gossypium darwinii]|uniref:Leucine-rich repeat-containing N-terminal plant-type domain-containing protein n=1 Tax=Gossypium darwinii TaxID=34276 RepID=A0A5D2F391_GOSDA|nr:hypothetical protein ES288_A10G169800v1 [Gossypium darwinii]
MMGPTWLRLLLISVLALEGAVWSDGCWDEERVALLQLQQFLTDIEYSREGPDCCEWKWVECNITTRRVTQLSSLWGRLKIKDSNLFNVSMFLPFEELRSLDLYGNNLVGYVDNEGFGKLSKLRHLEILDLSNNRLNDSTLSSLSKISTLKSLNLGANDLFPGSNHNNAPLEWLSKLGSFESLDLTATNMKNNFLLHLGGLSSLTTLILQQNDLEGTIHLQDLYNLTNLKKLDLSYNRIESIHGNGRQLSLINLEEIDLTSNLFNNSIMEKLSGFSNLKTLNMRLNRLNGLVDLKEFCALSNLDTLDLSSNQVNRFVTSKGNRCLKKLKILHMDSVQIISLESLLQPFSSVDTLFLRENSFLDKTIVTQELHVLSNVENLILDYTPLDINFLQSISILPSLKTLSLFGCALVGILPTHQGLCYLNNLEELSLNGNALGGAVAPCLDNLTSLRYLDISNNHFTGNIATTPLVNLTTLQFLSLSNNQLQVPMSFRSFANHSDLKVLLADQNNMVPEPTAFQTWWPKFQLKIFSMSNCMIEEHENLQLPNFLYFQHDLRDVDLSYCDFGGIRFPHWLLENNTRLEQLYMIDTSIVGPLFLPSHPSFNLKVFDISNNKVHHDIPRNFCSLFPHLEGLFMSKNDFKTDIPPCLGGLRRLQMLDLSHNDLSGEIPEELRMSSSLANLLLSNNSLSGKIIPTVYHLIILLEELRLDGNKFEGEISYFSPISIKNLQVLDVSDNEISGELPTWLWDTISLKILDFSKNNFEGPITMQLCNLINLEFLDLSSNHLSGTIPSCSNLQRMRHLHLANNRLSGTLSNAIFTSSSLVTFDLSGNNFTGRIPNWISTLPNLSVLLLKENQFDGEFPLQLCKLQSLSILDFSRNKLSGHLPSCLSNLTLKPSEKSYVDSGGYVFDFFDYVMVDMGLTIYNLTGLVSVYRGYPFTYHEEEVPFSTKGATYTYKGNILDLLSAIDLSCNQLTGIILPGFGNLSEIRGLNLSHNNLTGPIPSTFSKLKQIESLDLSYNNLSGRIPSELTEMTALEVFSVAHNNLSGPLPDRKNQFGTFDESNYEGNPLLCGPPLNKSCNGGDSPTAPNATSSEEEHGHIDMVDFFISFATSYAIIFLTTILVLHINPYWRRACFYFIEDRSIVCYFFIVDSLRQLPCFRRNI